MEKSLITELWKDCVCIYFSRGFCPVSFRQALACNRRRRKGYANWSKVGLKVEPDYCLMEEPLRYLFIHLPGIS